MISKDNSIALEIFSLEPGTIISKQDFSISITDVFDYCKAVGLSPAEYSAKSNIPSIAVAAWGLGATMKSISLPEGAVHIAQQIQFQNSIQTTSSIHCEARLIQNEVRRSVRFLKIEISITQGESVVLSEISTITIDESD